MKISEHSKNNYDKYAELAETPPTTSYTIEKSSSFLLELVRKSKTNNKTKNKEEKKDD